MKLLTKATAIFDRTISLIANFAAVILAFMTLIICYEIFMRYFLNSPTDWALEISGYCLVAITFLSTAWLLKREQHVKMDIMLNRLNPGDQSLMNTITSLLGTIVCLTVTWYGAKVTWEHFQSGQFFATMLEIPKWPLLLIITLGSLLLFIQFLRRTYGYLRSWRMSRGREQESG
ncbi:TRAP transporter small permease [Chloroflexota bacterium]